MKMVPRLTESENLENIDQTVMEYIGELWIKDLVKIVTISFPTSITIKCSEDVRKRIEDKAIANNCEIQIMWKD